MIWWVALFGLKKRKVELLGHITSLLKTFSSPELNKPMLETTDHGSRVTWDGTAQAVWFTPARVQLWSPLFCTAGNTNVCSAVWARSLQKHRSSTGWRWSNWSKLNESGWQPGAEVAAADRSCWEADSLCRSQCCTHTLAHTLTFKHRHTPTHTRIQAPTHTNTHSHSSTDTHTFAAIASSAFEPATAPDSPRLPHQSLKSECSWRWWEKLSPSERMPCLELKY